MKATRLSFVRVEKNKPVTPARLRSGVDEVSDFLVAHAEGLIERATDGRASTAAFRTDADEPIMQALQSGNDEEFLAAADSLAQRLSEQMKHVAAAPGLLVCTTLVGDADARFAATLKLEVVAEQGAVLRRLDDGEEELAAVTDVLDRPGDLQKGLVYPDGRTDSDAVVGEKANQTEARYFLRAMGVTLEEKAVKSGVALVKAVSVRLGSDAAQRVADHLLTVDSGPVIAVLNKLVEDEVVPAEVVQQVREDLAGAERPVRQVDTSAPVSGRVTAGSIVISGPASDIRGVRWSEDDEGGGWVVRVRSATEPRLTWT